MLHTFVKLIDGTIFINPGFVYNGKIGGSYCRM